jgi:TfoX/Sxy family transcriptional regulator of competence genes
MSTQKETVEFILEKINASKLFSTRAMFGEYALYAKGKVVALICDDQLYIKILPESGDLEDVCEKDSPYPGAKPHYLVEEDQLSKLRNLPNILLAVADALPTRKKKTLRSKLR